MKNLIIISVILISACSGSPQKQSEAEYKIPYVGRFILSDRILSIQESESSLEEGVDFQFDVINMSLFNTAMLVSANDDAKVYTFQDVSMEEGGLGLEDLLFTYSYSSDSWKIEDLVAINSRDSTRGLDLSGAYRRAKE